MVHRTEGRAGFALIEAIIALAILAVSGLAFLALSSQATAALDTALEREDEIRRAAQVLRRYAVLPSEELQAQAGRRVRGEFEVRVSMQSASLFEIAIVSRRSRAVLLETALYRTSMAPADVD
jgi:Tfp pilus assembly protein PilV